MKSSTLELHWQEYRLFPYERELAMRELNSLLMPVNMSGDDSSVEVTTHFPEKARDLTFFRSYQSGIHNQETTQATIENLSLNGNVRGRRQSTRYSVHGLHEYKGKFNPQVARALLHSFRLKKGQAVLDPFCGSGTTLVECSHLGIQSVGCDHNPLAVFVARAKLQALRMDVDVFERSVRKVVALSSQPGLMVPTKADGRLLYLRKWFSPNALRKIEQLKNAISEQPESLRAILLAVGSNQLREYSYQEPSDLRIRRRKSPFPEESFIEAFLTDCYSLSRKIRVIQPYLPSPLPKCEVIEGDSRELARIFVSTSKLGSFGAAISSPPYATALPYIDTQRLSLVWLGLIDPAELPMMQASLIGSREFYRQQKTEWARRLTTNSDFLPEPVMKVCRKLSRSVSDLDGFRRQAVPVLLYRYLVGMKNAFASIKPLLSPEAPFALIVGHNHSVLSGERFDIKTPSLLIELATHLGFGLLERTVLQTYQRYGLHQRNAVGKEELIVLRQP